MKKLLFLLLIIFSFSCEKYQEHCWACEYLRVNALNPADTFVYIPLNKGQKCDLTEDGIKAWMEKERDTKFLLCGPDTIWIENRIHCMQMTCR